MKVLLTGSGGRENALAYKICESEGLEKLYLSPGNPGTEKYGENIDIDPDDHHALLAFCKEEKIDLVVVGPEKPLVEGLADLLRTHKINVFGPGSLAAEIEARKSFAKQLMKKYGIPTAGYIEFGSSQLTKAEEYVRNVQYPIVIKADGLAAGKGVIICNNKEEAGRTIHDIFVDKMFGEAGDKIIIEEFMTGLEASIFAITDGKEFLCLPSAQDHKRIGDGDTGKNTGGMGAYSPAPIVTNELLSSIEENIITPALEGMREEGRNFIGCLYCGIMITKEGPKVVEFNCRFGDPETQAVLPLLSGNFLNLLHSAALGKLDKSAVNYNGGAAVCVVTSSEGYPGEYQTGYEILGLNEANDTDILIFHAGTKKHNSKILTNGGRVLGVTAISKKGDLKNAQLKAYSTLTKIEYKGMHYRKDIGDKALKSQINPRPS